MRVMREDNALASWGLIRDAAYQSFGFGGTGASFAWDHVLVCARHGARTVSTLGRWLRAEA